ncbi:hypothetical protein AAEX63_13835 [Luteococcus sp. H138]|uniref:hypothetical protein n=1 Tax=unclassified Luteococcus TaxID=2639923 RepID=UPI00313C9945
MPVRDSGDFVDQVSAVKAWAQAAHELLVETAGAQSTIEYAKLARLVQQRSGISTKQPIAKWIAPLLGMIARKCDGEKLPLLTALATRRDGSVGQAYDEILRLARIPVDFEDREEHAADQREACYRRWQGSTPQPGTSLAGATRPVVVVGKTPAAKKVVGGRAAKKEPLQGNTCPRCFMQMSLTGVCDNCD